MQICAVGAALLLGACSKVGPTDKQVAEFHSLYNAKQFSRMYEVASPRLRQATSARDFQTFIAPLREKSGRALRSQPLVAQRRVVNGNPAWAVGYRTEFENLVTCEVFMFVDGDQRIAGYYVRNRALDRATSAPRRAECGE